MIQEPRMDSEENWPRIKVGCVFPIVIVFILSEWNLDELTIGKAHPTLRVALGKEEYYFLCSKMGCVFPMAGVSILPHTEFGPNDHREDGLHFICWNRNRSFGLNFHWFNFFLLSGKYFIFFWNFIFFLFNLIGHLFFTFDKFRNFTDRFKKEFLLWKNIKSDWMAVTANQIEQIKSDRQKWFEIRPDSALFLQHFHQ